MSADMNDEQITEATIQAKGLNAPRLFPSDLDANIADIEIVKHIAKSGQVLRWAIITTQCGFVAVGNPAVAISPENDDEEVGVKIATVNSRNKLWSLMGYELKMRIYNAR